MEAYTIYRIKDRALKLLQTAKLSDCRFLVGAAPPNQKLIFGHKLILAMASSVFEGMFFGPYADKTDPILIPDVQPDVFLAVLEYIYSERLRITSSDKIREICYVGIKYQLLDLFGQCGAFLYSELSPKTACCGYEFGKLFNEPPLITRSMELIINHTREVIADPSFTDISLSTLMAILDQDKLNIDSELDLFNALLRLVNARGISKAESTQHRKQKSSTSASASKGGLLSFNDGNVYHHNAPSSNVVVGGSQNEERAAIAAAPSVSYVQPTSSAVAVAVYMENPNYYMNLQRLPINEEMLKQAVKKIRFLTMTPHQFAEGPAHSKLLQSHEVEAILLNILNPSTNYFMMPEGFSSSRTSRCHHAILIDQPITYRHNPVVTMPSGVDGKLYYCIHASIPRTDIGNPSLTKSQLNLEVDTDIWITGIQLFTQVYYAKSSDLPANYTENIYAHVEDFQGLRLTHSDCTARLPYNALLDFSFNYPAYISRNQIYKIYVAFKQVGCYPLYTPRVYVDCNDVKFRFNAGCPDDSVLDGLILAIVFTKQQGNSNQLTD